MSEYIPLYYVWPTLSINKDDGQKEQEERREKTSRGLVFPAHVSLAVPTFHYNLWRDESEDETDKIIFNLSQHSMAGVFCSAVFSSNFF